MFKIIKESCPYQNWTSVARERCPNPDHFHCLINEYGRIGWVCREPIWVEKDRCPVFNVVAKKLDTTSCSQTRCPPYSYRSNNVDVEYACRYVMGGESSTTPFTTKATDTNSILIAVIVLILVAIIVLVAGKLFYKYRRRRRNGKRQEESNNDLIQTQEPSVFTKYVLTTLTWLHELRNIAKHF